MIIKLLSFSRITFFLADCGFSAYFCEDTQQCLPYSTLCNGVADCNDDVDEADFLCRGMVSVIEKC